ncbi:hypothetical protein ES703_12709 [subsurface metagenome]
MEEIEKYSPMPPQLGPPLPGILKAYWPWVRVPPPEAPKPLPGSPSVSYAVAEDGLLRASMEKHRAEQKAKGLVPFVYE